MQVNMSGMRVKTSALYCFLRYRKHFRPGTASRRRESVSSFASQPYSSQRAPLDPTAPVPRNQQAPGFGGVERQIAENLSAGQSGTRDDWAEVEGCWVLKPPITAGPTKAVLQFIGGAFVGAAPQVSYRLLLETLAAKGILVIAAPFPTGFNHLRIADELHFKLQRCTTAVAGGPEVAVVGLGHSMGSLLHLLLACKYPSERAANILMSFNNKRALDAIPFFAPFIAPGARALAPILTQLAGSPLRGQVTAALEELRRRSPAALREAAPLLDQLEPLFLEVAAGSQDFAPSPSETKDLIRSSYGITRNMLVQFDKDEIDETAELSTLLSGGSAVSATLDLTMRVLPGDHVQPLMQNLGSLPPEIASAVSQGNQILDQFSSMAGSSPMGAPFQDFARGLSGLTSRLANSNPMAAQVVAIELLAECIAEWIFTQPGLRKSRELPPAAP